MANIALVVVTFNRCTLLEDVLKSALNQTHALAAIYVIDNNSSDNTEEVVADFARLSKGRVEVLYRNTESNLGGAGGFEYGANLAYNAGFDWIWFADDDVELDSFCLENLIRYKSEAEILQPMRINMDGSCAEVSGVDYNINSFFRLNPKKNTVQDILDKEWETVSLKTIPFEGPLISRRVFDKIGFPDKRFFIFYDDLDFALRAQEAGFKILCIRNALMKRKIPFVQSRALGTWKGYFMYRNFFYVQIMYAHKYIAYPRVFIIFKLVFMHSLITGGAKSLPMLVNALVHALKGDFSANDKYKP